MSEQNVAKVVKRGLQIQPEEFELILEDLLKNGKITETCVEPLKWIYQMARARNMSQTEIAELIGIDPSAVSRVFSGKYTGAYLVVVQKINAAHALHEKRSKAVWMGYCETSTWRKIAMACELALVDGLPAYIYGDSQIGKTAALQRYCELFGNNRACYVRMESSPTRKSVIRAISKALAITGTQNEETLKERILLMLTPNHLLVVDELHQALISTSERTGVRIIELLREIRDICGCGVVMCGTRVLKEKLQDTSNAKIYGQFERRGLVKIMLSSIPTKEDIAIISDRFGLEPPTDEVETTINDMIRANGLGRFINLLKYAAKSCKSRKTPVPLTWAEFDATVKTIESWAVG